MTLKVIGAGVGRTGTYSLKIALERLGFGPCYHMTEVMERMPVALPLWQDAVKGKADWDAIFDGYESAVDWPAARFVHDLCRVYPDAKIVLGIRGPESWAASFAETIYALCAAADQAPPHMHAWLEMATAVMSASGFPPGLDHDRLAQAFRRHVEAVTTLIPAERLLVFEASQGWPPLCEFLGRPIPKEPFPHANSRGEFWELIRRGSEGPRRPPVQGG